MSAGDFKVIEPFIDAGQHGGKIGSLKPIALLLKRRGTGSV
jgi:hypothetical protein